MIRLTGTVLDAPDAQALGEFYRRLLGWTYAANEPGWVKLVPPDGGAGLSVQDEPLHRRPDWPSRADAQQMQLHLDIEVDDLATEVARAVAEGATLAEYQPQEHVRVLLDPVGHPFCLWVAETRR